MASQFFKLPSVPVWNLFPLGFCSQFNSVSNHDMMHKIDLSCKVFALVSIAGWSPKLNLCVNASSSCLWSILIFVCFTSRSQSFIYVFSSSFLHSCCPCPIVRLVLVLIVPSLSVVSVWLFVRPSWFVSWLLFVSAYKFYVCPCPVFCSSFFFSTSFYTSFVPCLN